MTNDNSKKPLIRYSSRDFESIKTDLIEFAKRYYPDSYRDFNEASFGSLMLDSVAYVGDIISFYLDYQANESFLSTAVEYNNVRKLAEQNGYKFRGPSTSSGLAQFFVLVPALAASPVSGPDPAYIPVLKKNSTFASSNNAVFTLLDDVRFDTTDTEIVPARVNTTTGQPTYYALKKSGVVISGRMTTETVDIGAAEKFKRAPLLGRNINEIMTVFDSQGHEYYEVDYLTQNVVYKEIENKGSDREQVPSILRPFSVPRRFTFETTQEGTSYLQFGSGAESELTSPAYAEPNTILLQRYGRSYETEQDFDPNKLLNSDKLGIAPSSTTLEVTYRFNDSTTVNVPATRLNRILTPIFEFTSEFTLNSDAVTAVKTSLEVSNEEPIVGQSSLQSSDEIRKRSMSYFASQNRAVTQQDVEAVCYAMPAKFGSIVRAGAYKDSNSFKRNINLYVLTEDFAGKLIAPSGLMKDNLKNWLNRYKMIHDTVDILDGLIVNYAVEFTILVDRHMDREVVLAEAKRTLANHLSRPGFFGQNVSISEMYSVLNKQVRGVIDAKGIRLIPRLGGNYSSNGFDFVTALSVDGTYMVVPKNVCMELKYSDVDVIGATA
jgi:hypothetical protein